MTLVPRSSHVSKNSGFYTSDVPEIYMQVFWATTTFHHHAIRFMMDNKKNIVNLQSFRDMLHICLRVHGQSFAEPSFEEETLAFIYFLGHSATIRMLSDVNINKDYHMFSTIKLVSRHQNTQQFGALLPIKLTNEEIRNSNAFKEYYAIATGAAPPKLKASVRKTGSSSDTSITPPTTTASPRLTIFAKGKQTAKASKAKSLSALSEVAMMEAQQLKQVTKRSMQQMHISQASASDTDEGTGSIPGIPDAPTDESEEELSWNSTDDEGVDNEGKDGDDDEEDDGDDGEEGDGDDDEDDDGEEGNDDDDDQEVERDDDKDGEEEVGKKETDDQEVERDDEKDDEEEGGDDEQESDKEEIIHPSNGEENLGLNVGREEGHDEEEEEEEDEIYRDININQGRAIQTTQEVKDSHVTLTPVNPDGQQHSSSVSSQFVTSMLNPTLDVGMESIFETTSQMGAQTSTSVAPPPMFAPTITPSTIATITTTIQAPTPPTIAPSTLIQDLPNFGSLFGFDNRMRTLEANFSEFMQTNQFAGAVSAILGIVQQYMDQRMNEAVKVAVQIQSDRLRDEAQKENDEFLKIINENMQKIIKERRDDDADKDEEPFVGPDRGSKRRKEGKEPESASAPKEKATKSVGKSTQGTKSQQASASESTIAEEPMQTTFQMEEPSHPEFDTGAEEQSIVQSSQHREWFSQQQKPPTSE
nr:hypothetical protein [Tanacetum cinerariifolium]